MECMKFQVSGGSCPCTPGPGSGLRTKGNSWSEFFFHILWDDSTQNRYLCKDGAEFVSKNFVDFLTSNIDDTHTPEDI